MIRVARQQRRHVAGAGADFQHALAAGQLRFLQQPRLELRRQHVLAAGQRDLGIDESQALVSRRHEGFAAHGDQGLQHVVVQHVPGADLLLDHVVAGLFEVHFVVEMRTEKG